MPSNVLLLISIFEFIKRFCHITEVLDKMSIEICKF